MSPEHQRSPGGWQAWVQRWLRSRLGSPAADPPAPVLPAIRTAGTSKAGKYEPLHQYLLKRYAGSVVLTFGQIEDLLGFPLAEVARRQRDWWSNDEGPDSRQTHARAWIRASRTATVNLGAQTVLFERIDP